ncbi:MAG: hypothetical protein NTX61_13425 [Bacteroidetes bacterium]|nr:hypothetical protein [Bacteroidota bacterium]
MLLDNIKLSGKDAYLLANRTAAGGGSINLGGANPQKGITPEIGKGEVLEISGIFLHIESGADLLPLFSRQSNKLVSVDVKKEMFPELFKDPYKHRVHTISGYDDFNRGAFENLRVMEVDGYPTLVSEGTQPCKWISAIYQFPRQFTIDSAAWYIPTSKLTPKDGFSYELKMHIWNNDHIQQPASHIIVLASTGTKPDADRIKDNIQPHAKNIKAYQMEFNATVNFDTYFRERQVGNNDTQSTGRPLLRAINLLEMVEPVYDFYSLEELMAASAKYEFFQERDQELKGMTLALIATAALEENEEYSITVHSDKFKIFQARLAAELKLKPPAIDK